MLFNSYEFIFIFLPVSFFIYFYLNYKRLTVASKAWLVLTSLFFYSWWNLAYLPLILVSILINYTVSNSMIEFNEQKSKKYFSKKNILLTGLIFNVGMLIYFKYMDFFIINTNIIFSGELELLNLALPLAISFFTLQQIAFLIDSYEGLVKEKNFLDYVIFVTFFPQLIAGPIVHHKEMMPQFAKLKNKVVNYKNISLGIFIFSIGLFKKVVIADTLALTATSGFDRADTLSLLEAWATSLSYTFQLYFDFSGYTDMAIGAALLFNIKLPQNFNSPFKSTGIIEFWSRWHMTLTHFITTYIYTPILKSFEKVTFEKAMLATFITFLIAGLWHGASWMFVIFGGLHGIGLVVNHYWKKKIKIKLNKLFAWFITFNYVNFAFIFFRAENIDDVIKILKGMIGLSGIVLPQQLFSMIGFLESFGIKFGGIISNINSGSYIYILIILCFFTVLMRNTNEITTLLLKKRFAFLVFSFISVISILKLSGYSEFLYFRF